MRTRSLVGFGLILGWYGTFTGVQVEAQPCYRLECDQTQRCEAVQAGADGGTCCCKVECVGGMGGPKCSCISWCIQPCYAPCPTCEFCSDPQLAAGDQAFELTPAVYDSCETTKPSCRSSTVGSNGWIVAPRVFDCRRRCFQRGFLV